MRKTLTLIALALTLSACVGKAPVIYRQTGYGQGIVTVIEHNPYGYVRTPICRTHGFPEAEGFYGCSEDKRQ